VKPATIVACVMTDEEDSPLELLKKHKTRFLAGLVFLLVPLGIEPACRQAGGQKRSKIFFSRKISQ
jgi:hypothetical protein